VEILHEFGHPLQWSFSKLKLHSLAYSSSSRIREKASFILKAGPGIHFFLLKKIIIYFPFAFYLFPQQGADASGTFP